jgi:uncharacterized protein (DUF58 family)
VTRAATPKLGAYAVLAGAGLLAALVLGRPELVALAAPFAAVLIADLGLAETPHLKAVFDLDRQHVLEGESVQAKVNLTAGRRVARLELLLNLPDGLSTEAPNPQILRLRSRERRELKYSIQCDHWGAHLVGELILRASTPLGLLVYEENSQPGEPLKVYPHGEALRTLLRPLETQAFAGNQLPRTHGEGIEFADLRPFVPGDRVRRVNWRATARRGEPWVNETHPERNADVVIFLDTFAEARRHGESTLDHAVQAAATLAAHYIREKDRVGLVAFGGVLNWLTASSGIGQLYRVLDSLLDAEIFLSHAWEDVSLIPVRTLPPKALVLALTPLLDERSARALLDLRARGFDLSVFEISPVPFAPSPEARLDALAYRLWVMRRETLRSSYLRLGVPVVEWREEAPLQAVLEEVRTFRRHARVRHA